MARSDEAEIEDVEDVTAAESADLQTHHLMLYFLEQMRRVQSDLCRQWVEEVAEAERGLVLSRHPKDWLDIQRELVTKGIVQTLSGQAEMANAWAEMQSAIAKAIRANGKSASKLCAMPFFDGGARRVTTPAMAPWLDRSLTTWQAVAKAWVAAVMPATEPRGRK
ncbi:hypothetical protein RD110_22520 [Rhodoferax koreense]|uniref:Uncharacterized protein n=2 Tax=Rhodoferax koreensis TaxID=1842727 RepID=A0A1P8K0W2_9BURK|nr:hypothetical protein RD110_22520 [Rhodoferax koreense]